MSRRWQPLKIALHKARGLDVVLVEQGEQFQGQLRYEREGWWRVFDPQGSGYERPFAADMVDRVTFKANAVYIVLA